MVARLFKNHRRLSLLICISFVAGMVSPIFAPEAYAATSRVAKVIRVTGDVEVTKSGGQKPYKAFTNLYLNQGDHLQTGSDSSIVLEVEDRKDEVTVGPNSSLYVSKLQEDGGKETSFKMWSGSMWVKASTLLDTEDSFEVETPTVVMGVRGTQFGVDVGPVHTSVVVGAGIVQADVRNRPSTESSGPDDAPSVQETALLAPTQQLVVLTDVESNEVESVVQTADLDQFVSDAPKEIIQAILVNALAAQEENAQILDRLEDGGFSLNIPLDKLRRNVERLPGAIANQAVHLDKLTETEVQDVIDRISTDSGQGAPFQLGDPATLELDAAEQSGQQAARQKRQELQRKAELKQQLNAQHLNSDVLESIRQQREEMNRHNQEAAAAQQQTAEERFLNSLSDAQRQQYLANKQANQQQAASQPTPTAPPSGGGGGGAAPLLAAPTLHADVTDNYAGHDIAITFADSPAWRAAAQVYVNNALAAADAVDKQSGQFVLAGTLFPTEGTYSIRVRAEGYQDAIVTQPIIGSTDPNAPMLQPDTTAPYRGSDIALSFPAEHGEWRSAVSGVSIDGASVDPAAYEAAVDKIVLKSSETEDLFAAEGIYTIAVHAAGYADVTVQQRVLEAPASLTYIGDWEALSNEEFTLHLSKPGYLYLMNAWYYLDLVEYNATITKPMLDAAADFSFGTEYADGLQTVELQEGVPYGTYVFVLLEKETGRIASTERIDIEPHSPSPSSSPTATPKPRISGAIELPSAVTGEGAAILVYASSLWSWGSPSPSEDPLPLEETLFEEIEFYQTIWAEPGQTEASFSIPVYGGESYRIGYRVLPPSNAEHWISNGYYGGAATVYDADDAVPVETGDEPRIDIASGNTISGFVSLPELDAGGTHHVILLAWTPDGSAGFQFLDLKPGDIQNYRLTVPGSEGYRLAAVTNTRFRKIHYFHSETGWVEAEAAASSLDMSVRNRSLDKTLPYDVKGIETHSYHVVAHEIDDPHATTGMYVEWEPFDDEWYIRYRAYIMDVENGKLYDAYLDEQGTTATGKLKGYISGVFEEFGEETVLFRKLQAGKPYVLIIEAGENADESYTTPIARGVQPFEIDEYRLLVTSSNPWDQKDEVDPDASIYIEFSEPVQPLDNSLIEIRDASGAPVPFLTPYTEDMKEFRLDPLSELQYNEKYTVTIHEGAAKNSSGTSNDPYSFSFYTYVELSVTGAVYGEYAYLEWEELPYPVQYAVGSDDTGEYRYPYLDRGALFHKPGGTFMYGFDVDVYGLESNDYHGMGSWETYPMSDIPNLTASFAGSDIVVHWEAVESAANYRLVVIGEGGTLRQTYSSVAEGYTISGLSPAGNYNDIMVIAMDADGYFIATSVVRAYFVPS